MKLRWLRLKRIWAMRRVRDPQYREFLVSSLPSSTAPFSKLEFVALDIETTGVDPASAHMLSVGWVLVRDAMVDLSTAESIVVRPPSDVGDSASVHGLTDTFVKSGVEPLIAMSRILEILKGRVLVVHHAGLDKTLLDRMCRRFFGARVYVPVVDTMAIEHRRQARRHHIEDSHSLRLADLREHYGLPWYSGHNCLTDAIATAELLIAMVATHGHKDTTILRDLC